MVPDVTKLIFLLANVNLSSELRMCLSILWQIRFVV